MTPATEEEDDELQALRSLATLEEEAADDSEGIPTNPFGTAFGKAMAAPALAESPEAEVPEVPEVAEQSTKVAPDTAPTPAARSPATIESTRIAAPSGGGAANLALLQSLLGAKPGDGRADVEALKQAQAADKKAYWDSRLSDAIAGWVQRKPIGPAAPPSEAGNLMAQMQLQKQRRDEQAKYADAARKLLTAGGKSGVPEWYYKDLADSRKEGNEIRRLEMEERRLLREAQNGNRGALLELRKLQEERQRKRDEETARHNRAMESKKKPGQTPEQAAEGNTVPYGKGMLVPRAGRVPTKDDRKKVQEIGGLYAGAFGAMDELGGALEAFAKDPSPGNKANVDAMAQSTATALNTALGQGAMSKEEGEQVKAALGANVFSTDGMRALLDKITGDDPQAVATLRQRLAAVRKSTEATAMGKIRAYGYDLQGGEAPARAPEAAPAGHGKVVKETKSFRKYEDGFIERKAWE